MKQKVTFLGETFIIEGNDLNDYLHSAFPHMVEIAISKYRGSSLALVPVQAKQNITFREVANTWFTYYHEPKVSKATSRNTRILLDKHIFPILGDRVVGDITRDDIQSFLLSNPSLQHVTRQNIKIMINIVMKKALEDNLISKNPADFHFSIPGRKGRRSALSLENAKDIIDHLQDVPIKDRVFIMIPLYAGVRRGEMLGLRWEDIDFNKKLIHIRRSVTYLSNQPIVGRTKTDAGVRTIPLLPPLADFLLEYKANDSKTGYVINREGNPLTESMFMSTWDRIKKKIDLHGATEHVFRHTFATMAEPYLDPKTLQAIMGHSDIQTTMNTYAHSRDDMIMAAGENITDMYK